VLHEWLNLVAAQSAAWSLDPEIVLETSEASPGFDSEIVGVVQHPALPAFKSFQLILY
jgi:hypothetical protein